MTVLPFKRSPTSRPHLDDPKAMMGVLSSFEIFTRARVHRYVRQDDSNKLYYVGISFSK